ncbi:MAG: nuclear transport factor 2 family protein [Solirubrobacterales bacterium]
MLSDAFKAAAESWDQDALRDALAEDVVFRSPVVFKPYEGRDATMVLLEAVSQVFEDFTYIDRIEGSSSAALIFRARVGDREVEGLDHLSFNAEGKIIELRVMVRPMSGMHALGDAMRERLEALGAMPPVA